MGKQNIITKKYISRNDISSDLLNYYIFSGEKVIKPEDLQEADTVEGLVLKDVEGRTYKVEKYRDIFKKSVLKLTEQAGFLFIGIEDQTKIHYAMPVRTMLYDSISYTAQVEAFTKVHRKAKDKMSQEEFLSGMTEKDRLIPVITLVVYFGQKEWSAPTSLHEMLQETDPEILQYVEDYHIHLIDPHQMKEEDFLKFGESLQYVLRFIAASGSRDDMKVLLETYQDKYAHMECDAAEVLSVCANVPIVVGEEKEEIDMCKAWDDMAEYSREQGVSQGIELVIMNCHRMGMPLDEIANIVDNSVDYVRMTIEKKWCTKQDFSENR